MGHLKTDHLLKSKCSCNSIDFKCVASYAPSIRKRLLILRCFKYYTTVQQAHIAIPRLRLTPVSPLWGAAAANRAGPCVDHLDPVSNTHISRLWSWAWASGNKDAFIMNVATGNPVTWSPVPHVWCAKPCWHEELNVHCSFFLSIVHRRTLTCRFAWLQSLLGGKQSFIVSVILYHLHWSVGFTD